MPNNDANILPEYLLVFLDGLVFLVRLDKLDFLEFLVKLDRLEKSAPLVTPVLLTSASPLALLFCGSQPRVPASAALSPPFGWCGSPDGRYLFPFALLCVLQSI